MIGFLSSRSPGESAHLVTAFRAGLGEFGFAEGQNVAVEFRWAEGQNDRLPELATELVGRQVAVIVAPGGPASGLAAKAATSTIPIVFVANDPVRNGLTVSLNRPGANATGVNVFLQELEGKRLGLLREIVPSGSLIAVLFNPQLAGDDQRKDIDEAARALDQPIRVLNASSEQDIHTAFKNSCAPQARRAACLFQPIFQQSP